MQRLELTDGAAFASLNSIAGQPSFRQALHFLQAAVSTDGFGPSWRRSFKMHGAREMINVISSAAKESFKTSSTCFKSYGFTMRIRLTPHASAIFSIDASAVGLPINVRPVPGWS